MDKHTTSVILRAVGWAMILLIAILAMVGTTSLGVFVGYGVGAIVGALIVKVGNQLED